MKVKIIDYTPVTFKVLFFNEKDEITACLYIRKADNFLLEDSWMKNR